MDESEKWLAKFEQSQHGIKALECLEDAIWDKKIEGFDGLKKMVLESCLYAQYLNPNTGVKRLFYDINDKGRNPLKAAEELCRFFRKHDSCIMGGVEIGARVEMFKRGVNMITEGSTENLFLIVLESLKDSLEKYIDPKAVQFGRLIYSESPKKCHRNLNVDHLIFELAFHIRRYISPAEQPHWSRPLPIPKVRFKELNGIIVEFVEAALNHDMTEQAVGDRITYFIKEKVKIVGDDYTPPEMWDWLTEESQRRVEQEWQMILKERRKNIGSAQMWGQLI